MNHGTSNSRAGQLLADDVNYAKLAYSTHAAPDAGRLAMTDSLDSTVALPDSSGRATH